MRGSGSTPCSRSQQDALRTQAGAGEEADSKPGRGVSPSGLVPSQILGLFAAETHLLLWVDTGFGCWSSSLPAQQGLGGGGTTPGMTGTRHPARRLQVERDEAGLPASGPAQGAGCAVLSPEGRLCFRELEERSSTKTTGWCGRSSAHLRESGQPHAGHAPLDTSPGGSVSRTSF